VSGADQTIVGREAELERLLHLLGRTAAGETAVAALVGEPGVGKTRLARELASRAEARGAAVLWGAAYEDWTPPYGPWTQALTPYAAQRPDEAGDAAVLAAVVPAVGTPAAAPVLGAREEQFRLHDAVARLLAAAPRTLVVVLDDLHWADRASLELLLGVARSVPGLLVVATLRDERSDALARCFAELTRERLLSRFEIAPLNAQESSQLVAELVGTPVADTLAAHIYAHAQGNAFFTEELARQVSGGGTVTVPENVRLAVGARVSRLSADAARLLGLASVFTRPFSFRALQALAELPEETLLDSLDEALAAQLLAVARAETESYEFRHALVRQSLYEELNPSRRARLHRRAAHALEGLADADDSATAAELAAQYHHSASLPGAAHGVGYALAAADAAEARYAPAEAAQLLRLARDLAAEREAGQQATILCRLALAEAASHELDPALRTADAALAALAEADAPVAETANFLWRLANQLVDAGASEERVRPLVEQGLRLVGGERDLRWARLMLVLRPVEPLPTERIVARRWLGYDAEAVRIARASGDESDYAATLELMDWRDRDEVDALLEHCRSWREPAARIHALSICARTLLYNLGDFRTAEAVSRELLAESERAGSLPGAAYALEQIADVEIAFGEFESAREHLGRARATAAALGPAHRVHFIIDLVATRLALYLDEHSLELARKYERAATDPDTPWPWITIQAAGYASLAYARTGAEADAHRLLDEVIRLLESLDARTLNQNGTVALAATAVWTLRDIARAERCRRLALELVSAGTGEYVLGSHELTLARMTTLLGEHDEAAAWFARADRTLRADGRRPLLAIALVDEADAALAASVPVSVPRLREARELAAELGMTTWAGRAADLLDRAEAAPPAGLTGREVEILRLLADGRTNREIADVLVLSVHTVERHLANAYRKTGTRNRAEATAFALQNL
jgi:DNA-binding CsgD family transcriptional regulator